MSKQATIVDDEGKTWTGTVERKSPDPLCVFGEILTLSPSRGDTLTVVVNDERHTGRTIGGNK